MLPPARAQTEQEANWELGKLKEEQMMPSGGKSRVPSPSAQRSSLTRGHEARTLKRAQTVEEHEEDADRD